MPFILCILLTLSTPIQSQTRSQDTHDTQLVPSVTKLEAFQSRTGTVIVRAFSVVGVARGSGGDGSVRVECDVLTDSTTGEKEYGIILRVSPGNDGERGSNTYVDYDEITGLLKGIDQVNRTGASITDFPTFEASYRSKGGLEIAKYGDRGGANYIRVTSVYIGPNGALNQSTVSFNPSALTELGTFVQDARTRLDSLKR